MGRVVIPKALRQAHGLTPGTEVDISPYGDGIHISPGGRTAPLVRDHHGRLVADADSPLDPNLVFALIDSVRR